MLSFKKALKNIFVHLKENSDDGYKIEDDDNFCLASCQIS